jgi:hypothetical protein
MAKATGTQNREGPTETQMRAWMHYGIEDLGASGSTRLETPLNPVGEVRYVVGWAADQMSRMRWLIEVDGDVEWTLDLPDKTKVTSKIEADSSADTSQLSASQRVLEEIGWTERIVRQVTTNLYVAGELFYAAMKDKKWQVISVIHPQRSELVKDAVYQTRGLWPHPADPDRPDAPLFAVLPVLEEMDWLSKVSRSQSANRVSMRGIVGSADGLAFANGGDFWTEWDKALHDRMVDPTDVGPLQIRGAAELVEPSGRGMKGLSWIIPDFPYDERIDLRMEKLVQRLAYGLPIPPEVLLGLQAQSRATAFQVEENSYRAHIEPPAQLVAHVATQALQLLMPDKKVQVIPDPSLLLARRHTTQDVKDAFDRGAVSISYLREVLGIPHTAAATAADLAQIAAVNGTPPPVSTDPAERSRVGGQPGTPDRSQALGVLIGVTAQAVQHAREKVGARTRTFSSLRDAVDRHVPNYQVSSTLGKQTLLDSGVPVADVVTLSLEPLHSWYLKLSGNEQRADTFIDLVASHVMDTLDDHDPAMLRDSLSEFLQDLQM